MQSSPYHSNKLFDNRFSMMNIPKSSSECPWKLIKEVDPKTGSFVYKLVNSDHETNKNVEEEKPIAVEEEKVVVEQEKSVALEEENPVALEEKNPVALEEENPVANEEKLVAVEQSEVKEEEEEPLTEEEEKILQLQQLIEEKTSLLSKSILQQVPSQQLLFENHVSFEFSLNSFRSKQRSYMLTHIPPYISRFNSKDLENLAKNSRIIDFTNNQLIKIDQAIILFSGHTDYLKENVDMSLSFKFIRSNGVSHNVHAYTTSKIKLLNNDGYLSDQILTNIDAFLPLSHQNIYTYIPTLNIHKKDNTEGEFDFTVKVVLRTSKVDADSVDLKSLSYISKDPTFNQK